MRLTSIALGSALVAGLAITDMRDAAACGGCFHPAPVTVNTGTETTTSVVTDHRMVFKISAQETILWDQVRYTGAPEEFAWVLPVRTGAKIELSKDEFIATLDAATRTTVQGPQRTCQLPGGGSQSFGGGSRDSESGGCNSDESSSFASARSPGGAESGSAVDAGVENEGVTVIAQAVIGPYQAVTLHAEAGEGISEWLTAHKFAIPENVKPTIEAYTKEKFDFIALRLRPGQGVQAMRPVRVVTPGSDTTLPLRMVAAGVGAKVGLTLWVIAEGRYEAQTFPNGIVEDLNLKWDGKTGRSNLTELQSTVLLGGNSRTWLTETSNAQAFDSSTSSSLLSNDSIRGRYMQQCITNPPRMRPCDEDKLPGANDAPTEGDAGAGVDAGDGGTKDAGPAPAPNACTELVSGCDGWDDLEVAERGIYSRDLWITRLRADLPVQALSADLRLQAARQVPVTRAHSTDTFTNADDDPCPGNGLLRTKTPAQAAPTPAASAPEDDSACTCRTSRPLKKQTGTWLLIGATAFVAARIARRKRP